MLGQACPQGWDNGGPRAIHRVTFFASRTPLPVWCQDLTRMAQSPDPDAWPKPSTPKIDCSSGGSNWRIDRSARSANEQAGVPHGSRCARFGPGSGRASRIPNPKPIPSGIQSAHRAPGRRFADPSREVRGTADHPDQGPRGGQGSTDGRTVGGMAATPRRSARRHPRTRQWVIVAGVVRPNVWIVNPLVTTPWDEADSRQSPNRNHHTSPCERPTRRSAR